MVSKLIMDDKREDRKVEGGRGDRLKCMRSTQGGRGDREALNRNKSYPKEGGGRGG